MEGRIGIMARTVGLGIQSFEKLMERGCFYVDKTGFIKEWWESGDDVTLITRPRRFGKTLNMNMLERFFSAEYEGQGQIFEGLSIWNEGNKYRELQGTLPVLFLSFADVKANTFAKAKEIMGMLFQDLYRKHDYLLRGGTLEEEERKSFRSIFSGMTEGEASYSLKRLSEYLLRYYGKKVIILLDEYDTPLQEAWVYGYWREMVEFMRGLFNSTFKTNPYLDRAVMTGITRVSKESIFSDLNHLEVITSTSEAYAGYFGFTEGEVFAALEEYGMQDKELEVKRWYDGFTFGSTRDIYNPWSILNYLKTGRLSAYWANTSSNGLADKLIREGSPAVKLAMDELLKGGHLYREIDEQIVFDQLDANENAIWSLLLASGYLKVEGFEMDGKTGDELYELSLTNKEVQIMFRKLIKKWFAKPGSEYNEFIKAMLKNDVKSMNAYMNTVALTTFSYFDSGKKPSEVTAPEQCEADASHYYHGFVLGLSVELSGRYYITSNRESGYGRYDVMLEPKEEQDNAIIMEFKVREPKEEASLEDTAEEALNQIERQQYESALIARGIAKERIFKYGFAFEGTKVLIVS